MGQSHSWYPEARIEDDAVSVPLNGHVEVSMNALAICVNPNVALFRSHIYFICRLNGMDVYQRPICWSAVKVVRRQDNLVTICLQHGHLIRITFPTVSEASLLTRYIAATHLRSVTTRELTFFLGTKKLQLMRAYGKMFPESPPFYLVNPQYGNPSTEVLQQQALESVISSVINHMAADYRNQHLKIQRALANWGHLVRRGLMDDTEILAMFEKELVNRRMVMDESGRPVPTNRYPLVNLFCRLFHWRRKRFPRESGKLSRCIVSLPKQLPTSPPSQPQSDQLAVRMVAEVEQVLLNL